MFNLKLAFRALFRTPFVTVVAILSLGLGIGANTAIFSVFNQILLRPLPLAPARRAARDPRRNRQRAPRARRA